MGKRIEANSLEEQRSCQMSGVLEMVSHHIKIIIMT